MQKLFTKLKQAPAALRWLLGYALVLAGVAGLVYYWRVSFSLGALPGLGTTLAVAGVATVLYALVWFVWHFGRENIALKAAACVFLAGLLYVFATAPFQVPDEGNHYLRAWSIAHGRFTYDYSSEFPDDVNLLFEAMEGGTSITLAHSVLYQNGELATKRIAAYNEALAAGQTPAMQVGDPIMFQLITFLPAALGMLVARLFGFSALGLLYAGRLANLLVYAAVCYKVFRNCDKFRGVFMAVSLLPLCLSLGASVSYDSIMLALCFLIVSYFCKRELTSRDVVALGLATALVTYIKPMNIVLAAVLLLVPKTRWRTKWNPWLALGVIVAATLLFRQGMEWLDSGVLRTGWPQSALDAARTPGAAPGAQVGELLRYPFVFLAAAVQSVYEAAGYLFDLGTFGWADLTIGLAGGLSVLSLCAASALGIQQKDDTKKGGSVGLLLAALLYAGAVLVGMFITETPIGARRINGLQPRYFLPAILLVFMLFSILLGKAVRPRLESGSAEALRTQNITLAIGFIIAVVVAVLIFQNYFIGQWVPKGEGGHKLVNLFGWVLT